MTKAELLPADLELLQRAGTLLDTVGRHAEPGSLSAIECLAAVEYLTELGIDFHPTSMAVSAHDSLVAIEESLRLLAELSLAAFTSPAVVSAVDAAQRAFQAGSRV